LKRNPDQSESIAHTLKSTIPSLRAVRRTTWSLRSDASGEVRFGQAIHNPLDRALGAIDPIRRSRAARDRTNQMVRSDPPRAERRICTPAGKLPIEKPAGASTNATAQPSRIPSFRHSGGASGMAA